MRSSRAWATTTSIRWFLAGALAILAASGEKARAQAPNKNPAPQNANKAYSVDPKTNAATLMFKTKLDPMSGVIVLDKAAFDPNTNSVNINTTTNKIDVPSVKVVAKVTFNNRLTGQYTIIPETKPLANNGKTFKVDLTQNAFAQNLVADMIAAKPGFDPIKDLNGFSPVKVNFQFFTVFNAAPNPAPAPDVDPNSQDVDGDLTITLQQVVGELK
jgi:hypothetical protein